MLKAFIIYPDTEGTIIKAHRFGARVSRTWTIKEMVAPDWDSNESPTNIFSLLHKSLLQYSASGIKFEPVKSSFLSYIILSFRLIFSMLNY